ncbi:phosphoribosyltransferase [Streptosporangium oxazolinicum]|uniref:phosphoribosyltransferase n=1 Tax=Streptosporangium oxazolinicum TaxID=909287 RepID=UPI0031EA2DE3
MDEQQRVFERERTWIVSDETFLAAAHAIGRHERLRPTTLIVGIERGGVRLAHRLGILLDVPARIVRAQHNTDDTVGLADTGRVVVDPIDLGTDCDPRRILLVDDICGSGATMDAVTRALGAVVTGSIRTAVLCRNLGAARDPDLWIWDVADWVVFPWETPPPDIRSERLSLPERLQTRKEP